MTVSVSPATDRYLYLVSVPHLRPKAARINVSTDGSVHI